MKKLILFILGCVTVSSAKAGSYIQQASFPLALATLRAIDRDQAGNLYVLGQPSGVTTYAVASFQTLEIQPVLSFDTGLTNPLAFAVEANGNSAVLDRSPTSGVFSLKRFGNTGAFLGQATIPYTITSGFSYSAALDKVNQFVYLTKYWLIRPCLDVISGCSGPPAGTQGLIYQYDFQGNLLRTTALPGNSSADGSCYEPTKLAVDPQGNLFVADPYCKHLLRYSSNGTLLSDSPVASDFSPNSIWTDSVSNVYSIQYICTAAGTNCLPGIAKFSPNGSLLTSFTDSQVALSGRSPLNAGCAWDGRIFYLSSLGAPPLRRFIFDNPPAVPAQVSPISAVAQHASEASLAWRPSSDPDGDQVSYSVYLGASATGLQFIGKTGDTSLTSGPLSFGMTYFWQVVARGSYLGLGLGETTAPVASFSLNLTNRPPADFGVSSGAGTAVTRETSVNLSWNPALDPDGDAVTYTLSWRPSGQISPSVITTMATSQLMTGLSFGVTYYWSVVAQDSYGATRPMAAGAPQAYVAVFKNTAPGTPFITGGLGVSSQHTLSPQVQLSWSSASDPEGDPVGYRLLLGINPSALAPVQDGSAMAYDLSPIFGTTYYWQVAAYDPHAGASTTPIQSLFLSLRNSPPEAVSILSGAGALLTRDTSQALSWQTALDADSDPVAYELSLSTDPAALTVVQTSTATSYRLDFLFGTTYYWQVVARDGYGGATSTDLQGFIPVFRNSPPSSPVNQSKAGTILHHGFSPAHSFFWQTALDPDGDSFTYSLYFGTDSSRLSVVSPVPLGYTLENLSLNTAYYYKLVATDVYGAASDSPLSWVYYQFHNDPPKPFDSLTATGTFVTRDTTASLSWNRSDDPDGDLVTYQVYLGTATSALTPTGETTRTSIPLNDLAFGTTYYWRVDAYDGFGATTTLTSGMRSLLHIFKNSLLPAPTIGSGAGRIGLHTLSPQVLLSWSGVTDTEGDALAYKVFLGTTSGNILPVQDGPTTTYEFIPLFGTTYYWQAVAYDPFGASSATAVTSLLTLLQNEPPSPLSVLSGIGVVSTRETEWSLSWRKADDLDGDQVSYEFSLSTSAERLAVVRISSETSYHLSLQFGATYYWRVVARDGFGGLSDSGLNIFRADFLESPPDPLKLTAPFTASPLVKTMKGGLETSWSRVTNPQGDPITYTAFLGTSPEELSAIARVEQPSGPGITTLRAFSLSPRPLAEVLEEGDVVRLRLTGLDYYKRYYFKVVAENPYGATSQTPLQVFNLAPSDGFSRVYNYPNPFSASRGGTNIVFNAPPSGYSRAVLTVYSEFSERLAEREYGPIPPGISQVSFDGRDRQGRALPNGSYVGRVRFEGPNETATFYLLVVR